jgi:hypothetical protein
MKAFADVEGANFIRTFRSENNGALPDASDVLAHVTNEVKKEFKDQNGTRIPKGPPSPEGAPTGGTSKSGRFGESDLSEDERKVMNSLVKRGEMTKADYIKSIAQLNGVKS